MPSRTSHTLLLAGIIALCTLDPSGAAKKTDDQPLMEDREVEGKTLSKVHASDQSQAIDLLIEGENLLEAGHVEEALERFTRALSLSPDLAHLHYASGLARLALGQENEAKNAFLMAAQLEPENEILRKRIKRRMDGISGLAFPAGSLVLFDDVPCSGCPQRLSPEGMAVSVNYESPYHGVATLFLAPPRDVAWEFAQGLKGAFKVARRKRGGDLFSIRKNGAISMFLRREGGQNALEIGFREKKSFWSKKVAEVSLPLESYISLGKDFSSVVIPLADFPDIGYIELPRMTRPQFGEVPQNTLLLERHSRPFHWDRVSEVFLRGSQERGEVHRVWIDRWAIVPNYSVSEVRKNIRNKRNAMAGILNMSGFLLFGDLPWGQTYASPEPYTVGIIDEVVFRTGGASLRVELNPKSGSGVGFQFPERDLSSLRKFGSLRFYVRGKNGGERFKVFLHSRPSGAERIVTEGPDIRSEVDISWEWKEVVIPLVDFPIKGRSSPFGNTGIFAWDRVSEVSFESPPVDDEENTFYLDEIRFSP